MAAPGGPVPPLQPGQQPTPEQIQVMQQQFVAEAARQGLTPQQFAERIRQAQMARAAAAGQAPPGQMAPGQPNPGGPQQPQQPQNPQQQQQQQQMQQRQQQVPIQPGPPKPEALALAHFLKSQDLKARPCIHDQKRRELFKVKRAIRALHSPAYAKARARNALLPPVTDRASAENTLKLLPLSMLALRVSRVEPGAGPAHGQPGHVHAAAEGKQKGKKGIWTVRIEQQQEASDQFHYMWLYEGAQVRQKLYAAGALLLVMAVVLFPLWPYTLRRGVWYLSMGALGLLGLFFALAVVRLILFVVTVAAGPKPGIWIYPNLFEDVGFFDSFRPAWAWRETTESMAQKKAEKKARKLLKRSKDGASAPAAASTTVPAIDRTTASGADANEGAGTLTERRNLAPRVEEVEDE